MFDMKYKSFEQRKRHGERDGTAFATVALPAHYSAILSVLTNVRHRLGPNWRVDRVIDWGAATGSALWAALHAFQTEHDVPLEEIKAVNSTVQTYMGLDKRVGLVDIGKRILRGKSSKLSMISTMIDASSHCRDTNTPAGRYLLQKRLSLSASRTHT